MQENFSWLSLLNKEYMTLNKKKPFFLSDWDVDEDLVAFPETLIERSLKYTGSDTKKYLYSDDLIQLKELLVKLLREREGILAKTKEISLALNSTSAIYLILYALARKKTSRFLVCTPTYYTVLETIIDFNCNLIYFHLNDENTFSFDLDYLSSCIKKQFIDVLIITDPIYSCGVSIPLPTWEAIIDICKNNDIWLIVDYSLGGLSWNQTTLNHIDPTKVPALNGFEKKIIISSISKNMFMNNLKYSVIIGQEKLISSIENLSCNVSGGFCISQIKVLKSISEGTFIELIEKVASQNLEIIERNYALLETSLMDSDWKLYPTNSGYFTMIHHKSYLLKEVDIKKFVRYMLMDKDIRLFPSNYFNYYSTNHFAFRVNLLKNVNQFLPKLVESIDKYFQ